MTARVILATVTADGLLAAQANSLRARTDATTIGCRGVNPASSNGYRYVPDEFLGD